MTIIVGTCDRAALFAERASATLMGLPPAEGPYVRVDDDGVALVNYADGEVTHALTITPTALNARPSIHQPTY